MEPHLPHDVLYRPKMGFAVPLARWFRGPLRAARARRRAGRAARRHRLLQPALPAAPGRRASVGTRDYSAPLWTLLMFEAFLRNVVQPGGREGATSRRCALACAIRGPCRDGPAHPSRPRPLAAAAQRLHLPHARDPARAARARLGDLAALTTPKQGPGALREEMVDGWRFYRTPDARGHRGLPGARCAADRVTRIDELVASDRARHPARALAGAQRAAGAAGRATARHAGRLRGARALGRRGGRSRHAPREGSLRYRAVACARDLRAAPRRPRDDDLRGPARRHRRARHCRRAHHGIPNAVDVAELPLRRARPTRRCAASSGWTGCTVLGFAGSFYGYEGLTCCSRPSR